MIHRSSKKYQAFVLTLVALSLSLQAANAQWPSQQGQQQGQQARPSGTGSPNGQGGPSVARETAKQKALTEPKRPVKPMKPAIDTFGKPEMLTADKVQCDDLPQYTGKATFVDGAQFAPGGREGALLVISYKIAEPREQVRDWYQNALRMYGWNITFESKTVLNATHSKSGNTVALQFSDDKMRKSSLLQIDYHRAMHQ